MDKQGSFWTSLMICVVIASSTPTIPEYLRKALDAAFEKGSEIDHARVLLFLVKSIEEGTANPFVRSLKTTSSSPALFKKVAERMVQYIQSEDNKYPTYGQSKQEVWFRFLKGVGLVKIDDGQDWEIISQEDLAFTSAKYAVMRTVRDWSPGTFDAVKHAVENFVIGPLAFIGDALTNARNTEVVRLDLVPIQWDVYENIHRWWNGEISGTVCVKNIIDSCASVAGGVAGGLGGQVAGAWIGGAVGGPVGMGIGSLAGAIIGALGGSHAGYILSDRLTRWVFGLPKRGAIEKAYNFLGVQATASKSEINSKYRKLSLLFHPDKGGDEDDWMRLQLSMVIIRKARGEP